MDFESFEFEFYGFKNQPSFLTFIFTYSLEVFPIPRFLSLHLTISLPWILVPFVFTRTRTCTRTHTCTRAHTQISLFFFFSLYLSCFSFFFFFFLFSLNRYRKICHWENLRAAVQNRARVFFSSSTRPSDERTKKSFIFFFFKFLPLIPRPLINRAHALQYPIKTKLFLNWLPCVTVKVGQLIWVIADPRLHSPLYTSILSIEKLTLYSLY